MKLCRFELVSDPGVARSGIYHDGRFYETDGDQAIGIRDSGQVRLLAPVGMPPAIRLFDSYRGSDGSPRLAFSFFHPGHLKPPISELDTTEAGPSLDFDVRVAALIQEGDPKRGPSEVARMMLGIGIFVSLFNADEKEELISVGQSTNMAYDLPGVFGQLPGHAR